MRNKKRVMAAMSGGLDSSLAAAILKKQGYDVIGATMRLWPKEECGKDTRAKACCSLSGIEDARAIAAKLDVPYYVFDFSKEFESCVIDYFCREYNQGLTPNPCILCNQKLKFDLLLKKARELDCDFIATGHYAKVGYNRVSGRYYIREGKDKARDQSYFLAFISQGALAQALFPLGDITKEKARIIAKRMGLRVHNKVSSQEICFIEDHYVDYLKKKGAIEGGPGDILNTDGKRMGRHKGVYYYTIGQRKGLGIAYKEPLYVVSMNRIANTITVGTKEEVRKSVFIAKELHWVGINNLQKAANLLVKIRYGHKKAAALIEKLNDNELKITFKNPQEAITPGQAAVLYRGDIVLCGAWISQVIA